MAVPIGTRSWYACSMTINHLGRDTYGYPLPSVIIYSQGTHSYYPVTASPVCEQGSPIRRGREIDVPRYDGRMTTNSKRHPGPAAAPAGDATATQHATKIHMSERAYLIMGSIALEIIIWAILCLACRWS